MLTAKSSYTQDHILDRLQELFSFKLDVNELKPENRSSYLELIAKRYNTSVQAIWDKLANDDNWGYLKKLEERYGRRLVVDCPSAFTMGKCECGKVYAKQIQCGREWCPVCGAEWSDAHQRRFSRWWGKVALMPSVGYLVCTIPPDLRPVVNESDLDSLKKRLNEIRKGFVDRLKRMGYRRGLSRWHWFGDYGHAFHPHLNVLIDESIVSPERLEEYKLAWKEALGMSEDSVVSVHYAYRDSIGKIIHTVKYVTRATFRRIEDYKDGLLAIALHGYRNNHWWGANCWEGEVMWELQEGEGVVSEVIKLESSVCPECGRHLIWSKPKGMDKWQEYHMEEIGGGYFLVTGIRKRGGKKVCG